MPDQTNEPLAKAKELLTKMLCKQIGPSGDMTLFSGPPTDEINEFCDLMLEAAKVAIPAQKKTLSG